MVLIVIVCDKHKDINSTEGMIRTVHTSPNMQFRAKRVKHSMMDLLSCLKKGDKEGFLEGIMRESNNFHSCCLDTYPPLFYLNDDSKQIIQYVHRKNEGKVKLAYTFDAGPNCTLILPKSECEEIREELKKVVEGCSFLEANV